MNNVRNIINFFFRSLNAIAAHLHLFLKRFAVVPDRLFNILKDFRNAPFDIHCLFHMADLRTFLLSFLSSCTMSHELP